ncbi:MAG: response regulator [Chloroflexales bacterium]
MDHSPSGSRALSEVHPVGGHGGPGGQRRGGGRRDPFPAIPEAALRGSILLADDNEINVKVLHEYLQARGYAVTVARDGYEALAVVNQVHPHLILMGIQMPRLDGLAAIRRLRALPAYTTTPIIALTALAMPGDRERCLEVGATEYLSKPVSLRSLVETIEQLIHE